MVQDEPALSVEPVEGAADLEAFLDLPYRIYAGDPDWVPQPREILRRKLSPRNPLFRDCELRLFLTRRGDEVVGSISVLHDRRHEQHRGEKVTFFGFFECVDDPAVARALLARAEAEARSLGSEILRGPRNLSRVEEVGLLVEGRGRPPMLAGHSAPYYPALVEAAGYERHHDVLAYDTSLYDADGQPRSLPENLEARARGVDLPGLEIRPARWTRIGRDLTLAHEVFVEAFRDVPDNTPMPLGQWLAIGRAMLALSNRHMLQLATVDGQAAGFALCFPDLNEAVVHARGRLLPLGWWRALRARKRIRTASFKLIGVLPEYRSSGLHALMIERAAFGSRDAGYERLEASLVDARNARMRSVIEGAGMELYKRYRMFEKRI